MHSREAPRRTIIFAVVSKRVFHLLRGGYVFNFMNSEQSSQSNVPFHVVSRTLTGQFEAHLLEEQQIVGSAFSLWLHSWLIFLSPPAMFLLVSHLFLFMVF